MTYPTKFKIDPNQEVYFKEEEVQFTIKNISKKIKEIKIDIVTK